MCCMAVNKVVPEAPKDYGAMVKLLVCEPNTRECYFKTCAKCSSATIDKKLKTLTNYASDTNELVKWMKNESENRFENKQQTGTMQQLVNHFLSIYAKFLKHSFVKREQLEAFQEDVVDSEDHFDEAILQADFSENFKCESQNEIQQANYNQKQVSF